jgi:hypothetical protein
VVHSVSEQHQPVLVTAAVALVAVACCALPVVISAGVVTTLAGIGLRNWLIVLAGGGLAILGIARLLQRRRRCE